MRIETLGPPRLILSEREVGPDHEIVFALTLALLESVPRPLSRASACELLWPEAPRERSAHNLRQTAYKLRQLGLLIETRGEHLSLPPGVVWDVDERLAVDGAPTDLTQHWSFLDGYEPRVSAPFASLIERWRDRVHRRLTERLMAGLRETRMRTQWMRAVAYAQAILGIDPLNEEATLTLAEGRAVQGNKAEAVALLDRYLEAMDGKPGELAIQPTLLKRRITERMPAAVRNRADWKLLVGRDAMLESFAHHMRRARDQVGTIVSMWGEPGVGKTRLVREMNALAALEGWSLVTISCEPTWPDRPLCALEVMTSTMLMQPGALGVDPAAHRALMRLTKLDPADEPLPQGPEDSAYRHRLLRSSVLDLIDAVSSERPLLIAVDDAQWLDPSSIPFYSMAVEHAASRRVAWVFAAQQKEQLPKMASGGSRALVVRVPPLTEEESFELLGALVHGQPPADRPALLRRAAGVSNGNPLYVHTLATHWLSTGDLNELPPSLDALMEQRLDTIVPSAMRCLQVCALLGRHATVGRIESVMQIARDVLLEALDQLHAAGFLETLVDAPLVRHGIIAQRAVGRASKAAVVLLHRYIADVLEPVAREGTDAGVLVACAKHLRAANMEQRGVELIQQTARRLMLAGSTNSAWSVVREIQESASASDGAFLSLAKKLSVEIAFSERDRDLVRTHATELASLTAGGDNNSELATFAEVMLIWSRTNDLPHTVNDLPRAVALAKATRSDSPIRAQVLINTVVLADQHLARSAMGPLLSLRSKETDSDDFRSDSLLKAQMLLAYYSGDLQSARLLADQRIALARRLGAPVPLLSALMDATVVLRSIGDRPRATDFFAECMDRLRELGAHQMTGLVLAAQINFHLDVGDIARTVPLMAQLHTHQATGELRIDATSLALVIARCHLQTKGELEHTVHPAVDTLLHGKLPSDHRSRGNVLATRAAAKLSAAGRHIEIDEARMLVAYAFRFRSWPRADFVQATAARAIESRVGSTRALKFLLRLSAHRFEIGPATTELATTIEQLRKRATKVRI